MLGAAAIIMCRSCLLVLSVGCPWEILSTSHGAHLFDIALTLPVPLCLSLSLSLSLPLPLPLSNSPQAARRALRKQQCRQTGGLTFVIKSSEMTSTLSSISANFRAIMSSLSLMPVCMSNSSHGSVLVCVRALAYVYGI